jgi:EAL domain-containing protein (putative c-di-GMP-specific phosphodiesterase class I)/CheY-like chemotaxis protein
MGNAMKQAETNVMRELNSIVLRHGVIVVDDSELQRKSTMLALQRAAVDLIYEAEDGHRALAVIDNLLVPPAIVVVDLDMPGMDGIELIQRLAQKNYRPGIIIGSGADVILIAAVETILAELNMPLLGSMKKPLSDEFLREALGRFDQSVRKKSEVFPEVFELTPQRLRQGLENREIRPHYQPKISLQNSALAGVEALARWHTEEWGSINPARFISLAEKWNMIDVLTLNVLDCALRDMSEWRRSGIDVAVSINLSGSALSNPRFCERMFERIRDTETSAASIVFEITESALFSDMATALSAVSRLRLKGFGVSLDDYGTGFSSMQQLSRIPFTELKIDRSFVNGAPRKEHLCTILQSSIEMGKRLGLRTVAEGVETLAELRLMQQFGCDEVQGYLFARPMPSSELNGWLRSDIINIEKICRLARNA